MTQVNNTEIKNIYQDAVKKDSDFMKKLLKYILQIVLEEERDEQIGVKEYIRNEKQRKGLRNGYKKRTLNTRLGKLKLLKPQIREFPFNTNVFEYYQRSEKALILAIQQMVIDGVSTNKVKKITDKLSSNLSFSKSTVSRLTKELDPMINTWRSQKLSKNYAYLISDACYFYVRENKSVVKRPLLISVGVNMKGYRRILGVNMAIDESEQSWREHILSLKERGLKTVGLTISDNNKGLVKVLRKEFS
jgi:transposase-like protein